MKHYATALLLACTAATGLATAAEVIPLAPFESSYAIIWHGFTAGISRFALRQDPSGQWIYVSRNDPHGLFRLVPKASLTLTSRMSVDAEGVRPLEFTAADPDDGKLQAQVRFDWSALRASGVVEGTTIDMALHAGVQDDLSIQVAMMHALANGQMPAGISLFDKNGIRDYEYTRVGAETLQTPVGPLQTVIYRSHKANSPRSNRYWCAPELGYVPVQVEQQNNGKVEFVIRLQSIHRN